MDKLLYLLLFVMLVSLAAIIYLLVAKKKGKWPYKPSSDAQYSAMYSAMYGDTPPDQPKKKMTGMDMVIIGVVVFLIVLIIVFSFYVTLVRYELVSKTIQDKDYATTGMLLAPEIGGGLHKLIS